MLWIFTQVNVKQVALASTRFMGKLTCMCWNSHLFQPGCSLRKVVIMNSDLGTEGMSTLGGYYRHKWALPKLFSFYFFPGVSPEQLCVHFKYLNFFVRWERNITPSCLLFVSLNNTTNLCKLYFLILRTVSIWFWGVKISTCKFLNF